MDETQDRRIAKNTAFVFFSRLVDFSVNFISAALIARHLGKQEFGVYAYITAYVTSIMALSYFGLDRIATRNLSADRENAAEYMGTVMIARWLMSAVASVILVLSLPFADVEKRVLVAVALTAAAQLVNASSTNQMSLFRAFQRMEIEAMLTVVWRACTLGCIVLAIALKGDLTVVCAALLLGSLPRLSLGFVIMRRLITPVFRWDGPRLRGTIFDCVVLGISMLLNTWFFRASAFALNRFDGKEAVGLFQIPQSLLQQTAMIAVALGIAVFPVISSLAKDPVANRQALVALYRRTSRKLLLLGLCCGLVLISFTDELVRLLFGAEFAESVPAFRIVMIAMVPFFQISLNNFSLIAANSQKYLTLSWAIVLGLVYGLYFLLIPRFGLTGAAWSLVTSLTVLSLLQGLLLRRSVLSFLRQPHLEIAGGIALLVVAFLFLDASRSLVIRVPACAGLMVASGVFWLKTRRRGPPPGGRMARPARDVAV